jgi:hypothetical protein
MAFVLAGAALAGCVATTTNPAPDIHGIDADAKSFQLSDYRGKVVLLDFWGSH